jgi:hypothetical protein
MAAMRRRHGIYMLGTISDPHWWCTQNFSSTPQHHTQSDASARGSKDSLISVTGAHTIALAESLAAACSCMRRRSPTAAASAASRSNNGTSGRCMRVSCRRCTPGQLLQLSAAATPALPDDLHTWTAERAVESRIQRHGLGDGRR